MEEPKEDSPTETPYTRLRDLFYYVFQRVDYYDPHLPEAPQELKDYGSSSALLLGAGLLVGGVRQYLVERKAPGFKIPSGYSSAERAKFIAELKTRQLLRMLNTTLHGGLLCGSFGAIYFGVEGLAAYARETKDPWNTVMAAWASGAVLGFALGGPGMRLRFVSACGSVFLGGLVGYPVGAFQLYLNGFLPDETKDQSSTAATPNTANKKPKEKKSPYPVREYDVVSEVIEKLDKSLQDVDKFK